MRRVREGSAAHSSSDGGSSEEAAVCCPVSRSASSSSSDPSKSVYRTSSGRLLNVFVEVLLEDSWIDYPLIRTLLELDLSSGVSRGQDNPLCEV